MATELYKPSRRRPTSAVAIAAILLMISPVHLRAKSELQMFQEAVPNQLKFAFAKFDSCWLLIAGADKVKGANKRSIENKIGEQCTPALKRDLAFETSLGFPEQQVADLLVQFLLLSAADREDFYAGRTPKGTEFSPETLKIVRCAERRPSDELAACFAKTARSLSVKSVEAPQDIAVAVQAVCEPFAVELRKSLLPCLGAPGAQAATDSLLLSLRNDAVATVVLNRAAKRPPP